MASTNKTTHYDLPQWIGTDKPTFLGDLNGAFSTIDTQLYTAVTNAENANDSATSAAGAVSDMQDDVDDLKTWQTTASSAISGLQNSVNNLTPNISKTSNLFSSLGTYLSGYSPVMQASQINERLITIGSLKLLNIYGGLRISYTGQPSSSDVTDNLSKIMWENIYSKYNISTNRSFNNIANLIYTTASGQKVIPTTLANSDNRTYMYTQAWESDTLSNNGEITFAFQDLLVLN